MNAMMSVSHRLFAAALAEDSEARRRSVPRLEKQAIIELARHEAVPAGAKAHPGMAQALGARVVRLDSRLNA